MPQETPRRLMAKPAWKTQLQRQQFQAMTTVMEVQPPQQDAESSSAAASIWSPLEGYQASTSTQRNADAARNAAQDSSSLLDEADGDEYWHSQERVPETTPMLPMSKLVPHWLQLPDTSRQSLPLSCSDLRSTEEDYCSQAPLP